MKRIAFLLVIASAAAAYVGFAERHSTLAVELIELETAIGVPPWIALGGGAIVAGIIAGFLRTATPASREPIRRSTGPSRPALDSPDGWSFEGQDWHQNVVDSAKSISLPAGARLTHNSRGTTPFELHLDNAPPERCKRAVSAVAQWLVSVPRPPRLRVHFHNCPESGPPRHHQVAGSLATAMPRSEFKVTTGLDSVDVLFLQPDSRWVSTANLP